MINFLLNGQKTAFDGDPQRTLLDYLRNELHLTATKDGCSGQGVCGACTVEINGQAKLACTTRMGKLEGANVFTMEGFPEYVKDTIAKSFVNGGAVQCGFCIPGFISRTKVLLENNPSPTIDEVRQAIKPHICRCTGYKKIEESILSSAEALKAKKTLELRQTNGKVGVDHLKYDAYGTAIGERKFTDDIFMEGMLYGALKFSQYPRAIVKQIDTSKAEELKGVHRIFTAADIPGERLIGLV